MSVHIEDGSDGRHGRGGVRRLEPELLDHLCVEFGRNGSRAVGFLETARHLLDVRSAPPRRLGELVAYCIREALTEIPKALRVQDRVGLGALSRDIVEAAVRYKTARELPGEHAEDALDDLLSTVGELARFHREDKGIHRERLIAVMIHRAGVEPLSSGTAPLRRYRNLLDRVNTAAHSSCTIAEAVAFWSECVALLRQLFLPPELRNRELDMLAQREEPSQADLAAVLNVAGTPHHLRRFLRTISSPHWLWLLEGSSVLNTDAGGLWRSACSTAVRLADTQRDEVVSWLTEMHRKHVHVLERARALAHAAQQVGGPAGLDVLLKILRAYPEDDHVVFSGLDAALELAASDEMVEDFADLLMDEASWERMIVPERLARHLAAGIDERNACRRIELLCFKLNKVPDGRCGARPFPT